MVWPLGFALLRIGVLSCLVHSLEITLNLAFNRAKSNQHEFLTVEHPVSLLDKSLMQSKVIGGSMHANIPKLRNALSVFVEEKVSLLTKKIVVKHSSHWVSTGVTTCHFSSTSSRKT